jgi:hypothetical protein
MIAKVEVYKCPVIVSQRVARFDLKVMIYTSKCLFVYALIKEDGRVFKEFISLHKIINYIPSNSN